MGVNGTSDMVLADDAHDGGDGASRASRAIGDVWGGRVMTIGDASAGTGVAVSILEPSDELRSGLVGVAKSIGDPRYRVSRIV